MEINVLEDKKTKLIFEIEGIGHTFLNILKNELWNDSNIKIATYNIRHPIISKPKMIIETNGNVSAKVALSSAINRLRKTNERFKKEVSKEVR